MDFKCNIKIDYNISFSAPPFTIEQQERIFVKALMAFYLIFPFYYFFSSTNSHWALFIYAHRKTISFFINLLCLLKIRVIGYPFTESANPKSNWSVLLQKGHMFGLNIKPNYLFTNSLCKCRIHLPTFTANSLVRFFTVFVRPNNVILSTPYRLW